MSSSRMRAVAAVVTCSLLSSQVLAAPQPPPLCKGADDVQRLDVGQKAKCSGILAPTKNVLQGERCIVDKRDCESRLRKFKADTKSKSAVVVADLELCRGDLVAEQNKPAVVITKVAPVPWYNTTEFVAVVAVVAVIVGGVGGYCVGVGCKR